MRPPDDAVPFRDADMLRQYKVLLRRNEQTVNRIVRVLPPVDTGGHAEVLYLDGDMLPASAFVVDSKDSPPPLIFDGW